MENLLVPEVEPVSDLDLSGYRTGCVEQKLDGRADALPHNSLSGGD
jgi:hypothetical protein